VIEHPFIGTVVTEGGVQSFELGYPAVGWLRKRVCPACADTVSRITTMLSG
jgi:hypothetical protein